MPMPLRDKAADAADLRVCRALLREGSRSFYMASLLLPKAVREPASALYAFCRLADDAVDRPSRRDAVEDLRARLRAAYRGRPRDHAVDRAFAQVVLRHEIPTALPEALLEGLAWDAMGRSYETLADLETYAARVAGSVGAMMTVLMDRREAATVARACDLGVAMQLTNIARDVGEDARMGRLYLPRTWMREARLCPDQWLRSPCFNEALGSVIARLLAEADILYARAAAGIDDLPLACRPSIHAARLIYRDIGRTVATRGYDSVTSRAVVSGRRKAILAGQALLASGRASHMEPAIALAATRFLVQAGARAQVLDAPLAIRDRAPRSGITRRAIWLIDLFERLERGQAVRS